MEGTKKGYTTVDNRLFNDIINSGRVKSYDWKKTECEHLIELEEEGTISKISYPTRQFFWERLNYVKENGLAGVSIWNIELGMESSMDEF